MTAQRFAAVWEAYRLHTAKLARRASDQGQPGAAGVLGAEAHRAGRAANQLRALAMCDVSHTNSA